jgi:hypothetical protein
MSLTQSLQERGQEFVIIISVYIALCTQKWRPDQNENRKNYYLNMKWQKYYARKKGKSEIK